MADEQEVQGQEQEVDLKDDFDLQVEDDTPEEDRNRAPLPAEMVQDLEQDELEEYSDKVKTRLKQMKKVWHDERREKERAFREQQEAIAFAQKVLEENKRLKSTLSEGEKSYIDTAKNAAALELEMAKRAYKEAYDSGDSDQIVEAQEKLNAASYKIQQVNSFRPTLQPQENDVQIPQQAPQQAVEFDRKTKAWLDKNSWYGRDPEMTALALGFHQKLEREEGNQYVGSDDYWRRVDETMRRRFPEYFGDEEKTSDGGGKPVQRTETKSATVVAPASRSTSSKRVVLKASELAIAKKFGLTPEQYAKEKLRLEKQNG
jgi:hypothetical protein